MKKPFIKLFSTPNNYYFFDVNKDEIVLISFTAYQYLYKVLNDLESNDLEIPQEILILQNNGYLEDKSRVQKIKHPYTEYLEEFLNRKLSKITLQLTQNCNLRCRYCVYSETHNDGQRTHSNKHMTWETAKKAIDFLRKHSIDSHNINIGLYGGEPLLEYPLLKRIVEYSERVFSGKKLTFAMTSNATLLTDEIIHYLAEHKVSLMVSLDGPKEINDKNRVFKNGDGSYDSVIENIKRIYSLEPQYADTLSISMVMDPQNDFDCINSITLDFNDLFWPSIHSSVVDQSFDGKSKPTSSPNFIAAYTYQSFLSYLSYLKRIPEKITSPITYYSVVSSLNIDYDLSNPMPLNVVDVPGGPCIPCHLRMLIDVNGQFFPCERVSETSPVMNCGNLETGFNIEQVKYLLNVAQITESQCKNCWAFRHCSMCAKQADSGGTTLSAEKRLANCLETQTRLKNRIQEYLFIKEIPIIYQNQVKSGE